MDDVLGGIGFSKQLCIGRGIGKVAVYGWVLSKSGWCLGTGGLFSIKLCLGRGLGRVAV